MKCHKHTGLLSNSTWLLRNGLIALLMVVGLAQTFGKPNHSIETIYLRDGLEEQILNLSHIMHWKDTTQLMTFQDILKQQPEFLLAPKYNKDNFDINSALWLKIQLHIAEDSKRQWLIEFYDQSIDYIHAFIPQKSGEYKEITLGDSFDFTHRDVHHKNFIIPLDQQIDYEKPFYFQVKSNKVADLHLAFRSTNRLISYAVTEYLLLGLLYGAIIIMAVYNLLTWIAIREKKYPYYILHILAIGFFNLSEDGLGFHYLWFHEPAINVYAEHLSTFAVVISAIVFIRDFLDTSNAFPIINRALQGIAIIHSILFVGSLFFGHQLYDSYLLSTTTILAMVLVSGIALKQQYKSARFLMLACICLLTGASIKGMVAVGIIPFSIITHYSLRIGFGLEMLFLSFALSDRLKLLKEREQKAQQQIIEEQQEKKIAQQKIIEEQHKRMELKEKINEELEIKVRERTKALQHSEEELRVANEALSIANGKLNKLNHVLDVDNYKLKTKVLKERENRFVNKLISFEEFSELFPDRLSCFRYIQDRKWKDGYSCRKCNNDKYFEGTKKFSRRCTKCGYNESITTGSVFQGIKFDIVKAFYLCYIFEHYPKKYTLQQLADMLDMRRNTVWSFKKKAEEASNPKSGILLPSFMPEEMK
ncbi:7TM diverse intracellular signaling domain-containing protein [Limibacter armeniacum]|uniref:7TM diverse intracellular signaling domain-containing protein n=1 Tax=Limibacter armeniacum TaxID=466084 RepID=UPI002FE5282E